MRDPNRIPEILNLLGQVWMINPDLRLGQIVDYAATLAGEKQDDHFYTEDTLIIEGLKIFIEQHNARKVDQ
jgi:uncharacterized protein YihD (DUF1040 family)